MAYQALYRKWRPTTFDEVAGQDAITGTLKNQVKTGKVGHAYLFCGTRGCGKTSVAKILARAVNCPEAVSLEGNPCNACDSCKAILSGSSMNVFEIDAASNNGVDNIRDIREQVEYPPTDGKYKVYIIDEVHMLSTGAFNALLKTLEEPPSYVIFILATTDPQKVPQTILSRCQRYDFRRIGKKTIMDQIRRIRDAEGFEIEEKAIDYIADAADGSMRDALSILDQCLAFSQGEALSYGKVLEVLGAADTSVFSGLYRSIVRGDPVEALKLVDSAISSGKEAGLLISDFIWYLRNVLLAQAPGGADTVLEVTEDSLLQIRQDAKLVSQEKLIALISDLALLQNQARFAPRKRVLLEVELIRLAGESGQKKENVPAAQPERKAPVLSAAEPQKEAQPQMQPQMQPQQKWVPKQDAPAERGSYDPGIKKPAQQPTHIGTQLEAVEKNWQELLAGLSPANRVLFMDVVLKEERGGILVVFRNKINFSLASKNEENGLLRLKALAMEKFGLNVNFFARVEMKGEFPKEDVTITDEELAKINFPVTIEN